jgi:N6-adenosine-specific RNA methylase IME4
MQQADAIRAEPPPLPPGPFRVLSIDPPWAYEVRKEDPSHRGITPYPPMSLDAIRALPIAKLAADDAIVWLWTINLLLANGTAGEVLRAWGFESRTILTWFKTDTKMTKQRFGFGDWLRGSTEHCIMAVRGNPVHELDNEGTWIFAPMRSHSEKPDEFYRLVESTCPAPDGGRVDMFARKVRPTWVPWGNEVRHNPPLTDDEVPAFLKKGETREAAT